MVISRNVALRCLPLLLVCVPATTSADRVFGDGGWCHFTYYQADGERRYVCVDDAPTPPDDPSCPPPFRDGCRPYPRGDTNFDCTADYRDIEGFVAALLDPTLVSRVQCLRFTADMNTDRSVNNGDIDGFVRAIGRELP